MIREGKEVQIIGSPAYKAGTKVKTKTLWGFENSSGACLGVTNGEKLSYVSVRHLLLSGRTLVPCSFDFGKSSVPLLPPRVESRPISPYFL